MVRIRIKIRVRVWFRVRDMVRVRVRVRNFRPQSFDTSNSTKLLIVVPNCCDKLIK